MTFLLDVKDLHVHYQTDEGLVKALNGVSIQVEEGQTVGLVGETGAGKTTLARAILGLVPKPPGKVVDGEIRFADKPLLGLSDAELRAVRGEEISMIFQDPMTALNPVMQVGEQIMEGIRVHSKLRKKEAHERALAMLELVGISADRINEYPHQFSGGMKQRVIIAMALACSPRLLIADEPTTALDVTIQAQVLRMMQDLKQRFKTSMLLITHDLGVVAQNCDQVAIIYAGEIFEWGTVQQIFKGMQHPYTYGLFQSIPKLTGARGRLHSIKGMMPDPTDLPKACKFSPRCAFAQPRCHEEKPPLQTLADGHRCRCFFAGRLDFREEGESHANL